MAAYASWHTVSGRIDPSTGNLRLPVDDVPAILGRNEYVVNAGAVRKVGTKFLNNINNLGLTTGNSVIKPGTLGYGSKYQYGGTVRNGRRGGGPSNPITQVNLHAMPGEFMFRDSRKPYTGRYHIHKDGTYMIGAGKLGVVHNIKPSEVIVRARNANNQPRRTHSTPGGRHPSSYRQLQRGSRNRSGRNMHEASRYTDRQYARKVMNDGGWDLMTIGDCVRCGNVSHGTGEGDLFDCMRCRKHISTTL